MTRGPGDLAHDGQRTRWGTSARINPHENRMPFLGMNYGIALPGIFPQRP